MLTCYAVGMLTHDVALALGMSRREVQFHLQMAVDLLGASTKLEAVVMALRLGIIDVPDGRRVANGAESCES